MMMRLVTDKVKNALRLVLINRGYSANFAKRPDLWTSEKTVISPYEKIYVPNMNIADYVFQSLEKWPEKTAVVCGITNRSYTYHELYKYARNFAAQLHLKCKLVRSGDEIIIMMPNSIDYPVAVLGGLQAGSEVTTINPLYTSHELFKIILSSNPKTIIGTKETFGTIETALQQAKREIPVIIVDDKRAGLPSSTISYRELIEDSNVDQSVLKHVNRTGEDVAFLPYSSGTTGLPKQVEIKNKNMVLTCINQDIDEIKPYRDTTSTHQDSVMAVLPFFHLFGLAGLLLHKLSIGARLVVLPEFQPSSFLKTLKEQKISGLYVVPPLVSLLGSSTAVQKEHLKSVQYLVWGAAPLSQYELNKCQVKCSPVLKVSQLYGTTETTIVTASAPGAKNAGYAVRNINMRIVNENGHNLGPNEVGELLAKGPQVISRYRNNPEATKAAFTDGGWFKTGDIASINLDGSLNIIDRIKELIKVKGYQVAPVEIENVLKEHPEIVDAAVVGISDAITGEAPKAFVVFKHGHTASQENIKQFVENRVVEYKRLK